MDMLYQLTFEPVSSESIYSMTLQRCPVETTPRLVWSAVEVGRDVSLVNKNLAEDSFANLTDLKCLIEVTIDEPYDGKDRNPPWDHAHGFLRWEGITSYHVAIVVPAETFASLVQLAERGRLPSLEIQCISGHGLENDGPYGPMKWDTNAERVVPVNNIAFTYRFSAAK